jgi:hypothetical protein
VSVVGVLIVVAAAGYLLACLAAGFGPAGDLSSFEADNPPLDRRFRQPFDRVMAAYRAAIPVTPGMRFVEEQPGQMLVDMRPSSRVLGGNFGLVMRLGFELDGTGTRVHAESRNKVPFSWSNHHAAFEHAERALRTRAKRAGLDEVLQGIG